MVASWGNSGFSQLQAPIWCEGLSSSKEKQPYQEHRILSSRGCETAASDAPELHRKHREPQKGDAARLQQRCQLHAIITALLCQTKHGFLVSGQYYLAGLILHQPETKGMLEIHCVHSSTVPEHSPRENSLGRHTVQPRAFYLEGSGCGSVVSREGWSDTLCSCCATC